MKHQMNMKKQQQKTALAAAKAATAQSNLTTANTKGAIAQQNLKTAISKTQISQNQAATSAQKLATEQQRTAVQTANAAKANDRAALAALRLQQAQDKASASTKSAGSVMAGYVKTASGILGVTVSAAGIIKLADSYTVLQNKLQVVSESQEQVNTLTERLFEI